MNNRAVFLDRDGTVAKNVNYCSRPEDFELLHDTGKAIRLLNQHGFKVIMITNQSGIARGYSASAMLKAVLIALPFPGLGSTTTLAPFSSAICLVSSVLSPSISITSTSNPASSRACLGISARTLPMVSASLSVGIIIHTLCRFT